MDGRWKEGRTGEEYGRVQLNGKKDDDEDDVSIRNGGGNSAEEQRTKRLSSRAG